MRPLSPRTAAAVALLAISGLGGPFVRPAAAAGVPWTVQTAANQFGSGRPSFGYTLNPGGEAHDAVEIANQGAVPLHLAVSAADGVTNRAGKLDLVTRRGSKGIGAWVRLERGDVTVAPGETAHVPFDVTLPKDAAAGDYMGGIVTSAGDRRAGIRIRLRVGGALKPSLAVEDVHVDHSGSAIGKGDATVTYAVKNTGNAILTAKQAVSVSGPFGRWKVGAGKLPDTPPLLPGETWKASAPLRDVTPALRLTATVALTPLITDAAGSTSPLPATKTSGHAWIVPWPLLAALVLAAALVAAAVRLRPGRPASVNRPAGQGRRDPA